MFESEGQEFPLEIIDNKGDRWITRKQFETALGVKDLRQLHARLVERNELKEETHFMRFRDDITSKPQGGNPNIIIYSYRGIIRVAMASEGKRAIAFRDWAENVLYEVMVRGSYTHKDYSSDLPSSLVPLSRELAAAIKIAKSLGLKDNVAIIRANEIVSETTGYDCMELFGTGADKQQIKQRGLNNIGKWNIVESGGYYRAFRNINGKNQGVYIGKKFTPEIAREKIKAKGFDLG